MSKTFFVLSIAGAFLSSACVINTSDDDDGGGDDVADDDGSTSNTSATTASTTASTTVSDGSSGESSTAAVDSSDGSTTAGGGGCGWGELPGQTNVDQGYTCGGQGEDPDGIHPLECPADLVAGDPCGTVMGVGCCDAEGNVWYCADDGSGTQMLFTETC
jgi:hypothetical protein